MWMGLGSNGWAFWICAEVKAQDGGGVERFCIEFVECSL